MDEIKKKDEQVPPAPPKPTAKPKKKRKWIFVLFLLVLVAGASFLSFQLWQQLYGVQKITQKQIDALNAQIATLQKSIKNLQADQDKNVLLNARIDSIDKQQQILESSLKGLTAQTQQQPQNSDDWTLAEIAYLLTIANHRVLLVQDIDGALTALKVADERLRRLNNPSLLQVRTQLTKDINNLRLVKQPDMTGLAIQLAEYAANIENLPLLKSAPFSQNNQKDSTESANTEHLKNTQTWRAVFHSIAVEITKLAKIRYNDEAETQFLSPTQAALIVQNLRLVLESARFSVLRRDKENFVLSLKAVEKMLKTYYDLKDSAVKILLMDLKAMQAIDLKPELPNILGSLQILRRLFNAVPSELPLPNEGQAQ